MGRKIAVMRWVIWSVAVFYYFFEFIIRVMPSVMAKELMSSFQIDAAAFGSLSAAYMYAYAPMQIPVGVLMDRYGARRLLTVGAFLCGIGSIIFGITEVYFFAQVGRFLAGMGSAFGFVGFIYICNHWFSGKSVALIIGLGNSLGMLGAVIGQGPLSTVVNMYGWRGTSLGIGVLGTILGIVILLLVRNEPKGMSKHDTNATFKELKRSFLGVIRLKQTWVVAAVSSLLYLPTVAFAALWCVPYVQDLYSVDNTTAGYAASMIFIGWLLGGPMIGHYSDVISRRKPFYLVSALLLVVLFIIIIYYPPKLIYEMFLLLILLGVAASSQLLTYSTAIEINDPEAKGSALAITNCTVFIGACIAQPLIGWLLDLNWSGAMHGKLPVYSHSTFAYALSFFPVVMLLAFIVTLFLKEEHKQDVCDYVGGS